MIDIGEELELRQEMLTELNDANSGALPIDHSYGLTHLGRWWDVHVTMERLYRED